MFLEMSFRFPREGTLHAFGVFAILQCKIKLKNHVFGKCFYFIYFFPYRVILFMSFSVLVPKKLKNTDNTVFL